MYEAAVWGSEQQAAGSRSQRRKPGMWSEVRVQGSEAEPRQEGAPETFPGTHVLVSMEMQTCVHEHV